MVVIKVDVKYHNSFMLLALVIIMTVLQNVIMSHTKSYKTVNDTASITL